MAYQTPITIKAALDAVWKNEFVLPAIQREFVWGPEKICSLFDSLMQGFPVGSFLFWKIERDTAKKFTFFGFVRDYHERDNPHCPPLGKAPEGQVTAILDGQQRITALNIGLCGSLAVKEPNKWWNNPAAFPKKWIFLDLAHKPQPDEEGMRYKFEFLTEERASSPRDGEIWFPVSKAFSMPDAYDVMSYLSENNLGNNQEAVRTLGRLQKVIHVDPIIVFYEERTQDIEKVLSIFIRTNSGGTVLSYSDLLLSIATAQWDQRDARSEIHGLVDELNDIRLGFNFSKDFVLKSGLMIADIASVGFKVENFDRNNMAMLEEKWPSIAEALKLTAELAGSYGLSRDTIRADSALLPIAYYLHKSGHDRSYLTSQMYASDRVAIKQWLIRSLIKPGIWGSGLDVLLTALRHEIRESSNDSFPVDALESAMRLRGKNLEFTNEEIEELADTSYGKRDLLGLMVLMFPFVDTSTSQFHLDHIFPRSAFHANKLKSQGLTDEQIDAMQNQKDRLANLQLLQGQINQQKSEMLPGDWLNRTYPDNDEKLAYVARHLIAGCDVGIKEFSSFYDSRRVRILALLRTVLNGR